MGSGKPRTRRPKRIQLDGLWWTIHYVPEGHEMLAHDDPDQHLAGASVEWTRDVYVCKSLDEETLRDTLVHELMHSLYRTSGGLPPGDEEEENIVKFATRAYWLLREALG